MSIGIFRFWFAVAKETKKCHQRGAQEAKRIHSRMVRHEMHNLLNTFFNMDQFTATLRECTPDIIVRNVLQTKISQTDENFRPHCQTYGSRFWEEWMQKMWNRVRITQAPQTAQLRIKKYTNISYFLVAIILLVWQNILSTLTPN